MGIKSFIISFCIASIIAPTASLSNPSRYYINKCVRAFLDTLSYAEGTWRNDSPGYNIIYGGSTFNNFSRHPDRVIYSGGYSSSAAGAYQFLTTTWQSVSKKLNLKDFSPSSQDIGALFLIDKYGVLEDIQNCKFNRSIIDSLSPEWASLPMINGRSYYGQYAKSYKSLYSFYQKRLGYDIASGEVKVDYGVKKFTGFYIPKVAKVPSLWNG